MGWTGGTRIFNATFRSLPSLLKYDRVIYSRAAPALGHPHAQVVKGYYKEEEQLVKGLKSAIIGSRTAPQKFKLSVK